MHFERQNTFQMHKKKNPEKKELEQEMSQTRDECPQRNWSSIRHI